MRQRLLRSIIGLMLAFIMAFAPVTEGGFAVKAQAAGTVTIRFHYDGVGGVCDSMKVYTWWKDGSNKTKWTEFSSADDYGKVATLTVSSTVSQVGYIVATDNFGSKDYGGDRSVSLSNVTSGMVDVFLHTGDSRSKTYLSADGIVVWAPVSAYISGDNTINADFTTSDRSYLSQVVVKDYSVSGKPEIAVTDIEYINGTTFKIVLDDALDYNHTYKVFRVVDNSNIGYADAKLDFNSDFFIDNYTYDGDDLGSVYTAEATTFKVWAPTAKNVEVLLFNSGSEDTEPYEIHEMTGGTVAEKGVWSYTAAGDYKDKYYLYRVDVAGNKNLAMDPYAKAGDTSNDNPVKSNYYAGQRSMIVDLETVCPQGWSEDTHVVPENATDAIIYETSVRDFSSDSDSGISAAHRMKYLAFTEHGTKNSKGSTTGIDYLKNLGITHVQIMPSYDFSGTNEKTMTSYNWGYNPVNYNIPEGAFSTDPTNGKVRVTEYKQMVQALHNENIGVIMDVVYNHVNNKNTFCFEKIVPGYFFRAGSNGSGCGNDVASERKMVSKYIVDSVTYWAEEYHLDGFRFDLVGLLDIDTMNNLRAELDKINPGIMIYGEGWTLGTSLSRNVDLATQTNVSKMPGVGVFNDRIRNAVGGNVGYSSKIPEKGFATGNPNATSVNDIKNYIKSALDYTNNPLQNINYLSCHDNYTLWDKISGANKTASVANKIQMNKLAAAMNITSQGIPLFLSGEEFLRTKNGDENSYKSSDAVNMMDWSRIDDYASVVNYYKGLIEFRKTHSGLRMTSAESINSNLKFINTGNKVVEYTIDGNAENEIADKILVAFNPYSSSKNITLPDGEWKVCVNGEEAGAEPISIASGSLSLTPYSAYILVQGNTGTGSRTEIFNTDYDLETINAKYTGKECKPAVTNVHIGDTSLVEGKDYEIRYSNNVNAGTATVTVVGINNYVGRITKTFTIGRAENSLKISCANVTYGTAVSPKVTANTGKAAVSYKYKKYGRADSTYTSTKPKAAGTYVVKAISVSTANYNSATTTCTFKILPKNLKNAKVSGVASTFNYTGKAIKQSKIVVKDGNKTLVNGKDYTLSYSANTNIGTAKVTIKGKGNYTGSVSKTYKIVLGKTTGISVSAGTKKATVKWSKVTGANGYQIYMATSRNGRYSNIKTITKGLTVKYVKTRLSKRKTYYYKVRAYKKVGKKTYYGKWSLVKSARIK